MEILLADDHHVVRDGLQALIRHSLPHPVRFHEAANFDEAERVMARQPALRAAIVDLHMGGETTAAPVVRLAQAFPCVPLLVVSGFLEQDVIRRLLGVPSVHALVSKNAQPKSICYALLEALAGRHVGDVDRLLEIRDAGLMDPGGSPITLTPRLAEIHQLVREGNSNKAIAHRLQLSEGTVKNYVSEILKILKVSNRTQASHRTTAGSPPDGTH